MDINNLKKGNIFLIVPVVISVLLILIVLFSLLYSRNVKNKMINTLSTLVRDSTPKLHSPIIEERILSSGKFSVHIPNDAISKAARFYLTVSPEPISTTDTILIGSDYQLSGTYQVGGEVENFVTPFFIPLHLF